jgi:hypothetical protein
MRSIRELRKMAEDSIINEIKDSNFTSNELNDRISSKMQQIVDLIIKSDELRSSLIYLEKEINLDQNILTVLLEKKG